jgi:ATP-dependent helicase HrpB
VVRELQDTVRPICRLVVMSATLDTEALAAYLESAAVTPRKARRHPVDVAYDDAGHGLRLDDRVVAVVRRELRHPGDVPRPSLPGAGEIRALRAARARRSPRPKRFDVSPATATNRSTSRLGAPCGAAPADRARDERR